MPGEGKIFGSGKRPMAPWVLRWFSPGSVMKSRGLRASPYRGARSYPPPSRPPGCSPHAVGKPPGLSVPVAGSSTPASIAAKRSRKLLAVVLATGTGGTPMPDAKGIGGKVTDTGGAPIAAISSEGLRRGFSGGNGAVIIGGGGSVPPRSTGIVAGPGGMRSETGRILGSGGIMRALPSSGLSRGMGGSPALTPGIGGGTPMPDVKYSESASFDAGGRIRGIGGPAGTGGTPIPEAGGILGMSGLPIAPSCIDGDVSRGDRASGGGSIGPRSTGSVGNPGGIRSYPGRIGGRGISGALPSAAISSEGLRRGFDRGNGGKSLGRLGRVGGLGGKLRLADSVGVFAIVGK